MSMTERLKAWQCIGCGRLEAPQTCIGVCQDRPVELVYAADYDELVDKLDEPAARTRLQAQQAIALVRQLATTTPRAGEWERSYREMQRRAREVIGTTSQTPELQP